MDNKYVSPIPADVRTRIAREQAQVAQQEAPGAKVPKVPAIKSLRILDVVIVGLLIANLVVQLI